MYEPSCSVTTIYNLVRAYDINLLSIANYFIFLL